MAESKLTFKVNAEYIEYLVLRAACFHIVAETHDSWCDDCQYVRDLLASVLETGDE